MGLDSFNVAEDNKGGRKPTQESEDFERTRIEDAHTLHKCSEEYWEEQLEKHSGGDKPSPEEMRAICEAAHVSDRTVKSKLDEYGIYDYDVSPDVTEESGGSSDGRKEDSALFNVVKNA